MSGLLSYSPTEVKLSLAGLFEVTGYDSEHMVTLTKNTVDYRSGGTAMDGYSERIHRKDDDYTLTVHLSQSSVFNDVFAAIHTLDRLTQQAKVPLLLVDRSGTTKFLCTNAYILGIPPTEYGTTLRSRPWKIYCPNATLTLGGNEVDTTSILATLTQLAGPLTSLLGAAGISL